jgi:hypothetical protein
MRQTRLRGATRGRAFVTTAIPDNAMVETINGLYKPEGVQRRGPWKGLNDKIAPADRKKVAAVKRTRPIPLDSNDRVSDSGTGSLRRCATSDVSSHPRPDGAS